MLNLLNLKRNGTTIELTFDHKIRYGTPWITTFQQTAGSEYYAQLQYAQLKDTLEAAIVKARREAYEQGWKDKSSKNPKKDWFSTQL